MMPRIWPIIARMSAWPELAYHAWKDTYAALHMWFQIVGKIRLARSPWVNHQWHVTLYVTARGLSTSTIPHGARIFQLDFDFIDHRLAILTSDGAVRSIRLEPQPVAAFYGKVMAALDELGVPVRISKKPNEVADAIAFDEDRAPRAYDPEYAGRFWRALVQADRVFKVFRGRFCGKSSPVHFFWGAADLAVSRFSGRTAPAHPGGLPNMPDRLVREAYSHECSSCGFWAGGERYPQPMFFSYAYPEPRGFKDALPGYEAALGEYVLPYDAVRTASSPDEKLLDFLQSTYEAAASLGGWDRRALEMDSAAGPISAA
jgi:hypothetical protein